MPTVEELITSRYGMKSNHFTTLPQRKIMVKKLFFTPNHMVTKHLNSTKRISFSCYRFIIRESAHICIGKKSLALFINKKEKTLDFGGL